MSTAEQHHLTDSRCPPDCDEQVVDEVCGLMVCTVHSPEAEVVECVESKVRLHHNECRDECPDCIEAARPDAAQWKGWL